MRTLISRLFGTLLPQRGDRRIEESIGEHLDALAEAYEARGMSAHEAQAAARREFGPVEPMKESYRDQARFRPIENLARDIRFAFRQFRKSPGLTALAIVSLALGIGANTALFSLVNAVLLKRLPAPDPERLVQLQSEGKPTVLSYEQLQFLDRNATQTEGLLGRFPIDVSVIAQDTPRWVAAELVTGDYFHTLRLRAARGRLMTQSDLDNAEGNPVCVVSYGFWQNRLRGDPHVVGRKLRINMREYQIIGVGAHGFAGMQLQQPVDIQIPATRLADFMPAFVGMPRFNWRQRLSLFSTVGRLRPGASMTAAATELTRLNESYKRSLARDKPPSIGVAPASGGIGGPEHLATSAEVLFAVSSLVLLIACANLATLLLSRATARSSEFAVRLSLGGSRARVMLQVFTKSAMLALCGAIAGIVVAYGIAGGTLHFLNRANPAIHRLHVSPDQTVLFFGAAVSIACVLLFGTAPALQAARTARLGASTGNTMPGAGLRKIFVAVQIALSVVVLFAAGLLTRSLSKLETVDLGYKPDEIAVLDMRPAAGGYDSAAASQFYTRVVAKLRATPGIKAAATTFNIGVQGSTPMKLDAVPGASREVQVNISGVGPGYFKTIGTRFIEGRDFNANDTAKAPAVYIINQHLARTYFHGLDPIGRYLVENGRKLPVIGVVADVHDYGLRDGYPDTVYQDADQYLASSLKVFARCNRSCESLLSTIRAEIAKMDPNTPILNIDTVKTEIDATLSSEQILGFLSSWFGGLAILLTAAGLYGVISFAVARRSREIGLRIAIGATVQDILRLLLKEISSIIVVGTILGIPAALAAVDLLRSQLFGVTAYDPPALLAATGRSWRPSQWRQQCRCAGPFA